METVAVLLVLCSAVMHATWNMLARRSIDPFTFFFCFNVAAVVIWGPLALLMLRRHPVEPVELLLMLGSGMLQVAYFFTLAGAYKRGGLSLVYPIARGTGVAIVPAAAVVLFDERPSVAAIVGVAAVLGGLGLIGWDAFMETRGLAGDSISGAVTFAGVTGLVIATYSLVDKYGVGRVHPVVYGYGLIVVTAGFYAPYVLLRRRVAAVAEWRAGRTAILAGGVLSLGTYLLVLAAFRTANVGYVVPLRETSIVFGIILSIFVLHEPVRRLRILAAVAIAGGAVAISLGG